MAGNDSAIKVASIPATTRGTAKAESRQMAWKTLFKVRPLMMSKS
jgi:hypothetical protein